MLPSLPRVSDVSYSNMRKYTYVQNYLYRVKFNHDVAFCIYLSHGSSRPDNAGVVPLGSPYEPTTH